MSSLIPSNVDVSTILATAAFCYFGVPLVRSITRIAWFKLRVALNAKRRKQIREKKREELAKQLNAAALFVEKHKERVGEKERKLFPTMTGTELVEMIVAKKTYTCVEVLAAFTANMLEAHKKTNCIVAVCMERAIARAQYLDTDGIPKLMAESGGSTAAVMAALPLCGLPVSIKENVDVKGLDTTIGVHDLCFQPAKEDGGEVASLEYAGAVIFCKTNVPQTMLSFECFNELFGETSNPYSDKHSCGGSSGGEGALIAMGGCAFGMGSDIGGSIRIPAHFCGTVGLKPSQWRVSHRGCKTSMTGIETVAGVQGPMARHVEDLALAFDVMCCKEPSEEDPHCFANKINRLDGNSITAFLPRVLPTLSTTALSQRKRRMRFGYYHDDGFVKTTAPCRRALDEAIDAIKTQAPHLVPFDVEFVDISSRMSGQSKFCSRVMDVFFRVIAADGGVHTTESIHTDKPSPHVGPVLMAMMLPTGLRQAISWILSPIDARLSQFIAALVPSSFTEILRLSAKRNKLRMEFAAIFQELELDAVLAPGFATPAVPLMSSTQASPGCSMTAAYNLLDAAAVTVPVTRVDKEIDTEPWTDPAAPGCPLMNKRIAPMYGGGAESAHGLPLGVQIITPRFREHEAMIAAVVVERCVKRNKGTK